MTLDGFCDSPDGSLYRVRFMPTQAGRIRVFHSLRQGAFEKPIPARSGPWTAGGGAF
jgi:hypothetical protein